MSQIRELATGCSGPRGAGRPHPSVNAGHPGLGSGYRGGTAATLSWAPCSLELSGRLPLLPVTSPAAREPGGAPPRGWGGRTSPTYVVILGRVARGRPEEVLGELVLREPVDFAALSATCASPPPHPQVLT